MQNEWGQKAPTQEQEPLDPLWNKEVTYDITNNFKAMFEDTSYFISSLKEKIKRVQNLIPLHKNPQILCLVTLGDSFNQNAIQHASITWDHLSNPNLQNQSGLTFLILSISCWGKEVEAHEGIRWQITHLFTRVSWFFTSILGSLRQKNVHTETHTWSFLAKPKSFTCQIVTSSTALQS